VTKGCKKKVDKQLLSDTETIIDGFKKSNKSHL